jgi:hypothetical protein
MCAASRRGDRRCEGVIQDKMVHGNRCCDDTSTTSLLWRCDGVGNCGCG